MHHFTAHRLRFVTEAQSTIELNEHQGSAIRGSLFHALRNRFCGNRKARECASCPLVATCPVATLVSTLNPQGRRGRDVPRPYTVQPPLPGSNGQPALLSNKHVVYRYPPGARLEFGLTLYAQALSLFPYVVLSIQGFERGGLGRKTQHVDGHWRRGKLLIREVWAENPLTMERHAVIRHGENLVQMPDVPLTHQAVLAVPAPSPGQSVTFRFLTPTRLVTKKHLIRPQTFHFQPFFQRLMERLESLSRQFSNTPLVFTDPKGLIAAAGEVWTVQNKLHWEELRSYSTRRRAESPTAGFIGTVTLASEDWEPFWPWLIWGQFVHVGKDAVKGNGQYLLEPSGVSSPSHLAFRS